MVCDIEYMVGIWYIVHGTWEFPQIRGPNIDTRKKGFYKNAHTRHPQFMETAIRNAGARYAAMKLRFCVHLVRRSTTLRDSFSNTGTG